MELLAFVKGIFADDERVTHEVKSRIRAAGFKIIESHYVNYTYEEGCEHYIEHQGRSYFPKLVKYVSSNPIYAMILETPKNLSEEESVALLRSLAGATMKIRPEYKEFRSELEEKLPTMSLEEIDQYYILPAEGTIRYDIPVKYGYKFDITKNVIHTSDSKENGIRETELCRKAVARESSITQ